jgi:hypothetical protein
MVDQPTILVKKADGTTVRMTFEEVRKLKDKPRPSILPSVAVIPPPLTFSNPSVGVSNNIKDFSSVEGVPASPAWARSSNLDVNISQKKLSIENSSLLEETPPPAHPALSVTSANREDNIDEIVSSLSFSPPSDLDNRFRTILQLFLKDIRTINQTKDALSRHPLQGGIGFNESQVKAVLSACQKSIEKNTYHAKNNLPLVPPLRVATLPATTSPNNSFRHAPLLTPPLNVLDKRSEIYPPNLKSVLQTSSVSTSLKLSRQSVKTKIQDILPPAYHNAFGPVDEIAAITLTDFRRLGNTPVEAAARLKQKFINLREESVLLYFEAAEAWRQSPLYKGYVASVLEHIVKGQKFSDNSANKEAVQETELVAIVTMERELNML